MGKPFCRNVFVAFCCTHSCCKRIQGFSLQNQPSTFNLIPFEAQTFIPSTIWNMLVREYALNFQARQINFSGLRPFDYIQADRQEQLLDDFSVDGDIRELLAVCTLIVQNPSYRTPQEVIAAINKHDFVHHILRLGISTSNVSVFGKCQRSPI
eukprot:g31524.t1